MSLSRILLFSLAFVTYSLTGQNQVRWMSLEEAIEKSKEEPKKVFIDVYTEWCGWCKKMDQSTFKNDNIARYINENFYAVKFDAEYKEDITFKGKTFKYIKTYRGGYHELATHLLNGRLSFPSTVYLDENLDLIQAIPGYQDFTSLDMILHFFCENHHKKTPWRRYQKNYMLKHDQGMGFPVSNKN